MNATENATGNNTPCIGIKTGQGSLTYPEQTYQISEISEIKAKLDSLPAIGGPIKFQLEGKRYSLSETLELKNIYRPITIEGISDSTIIDGLQPLVSLASTPVCMYASVKIEQSYYPRQLTVCETAILEFELSSFELVDEKSGRYSMTCPAKLRYVIHVGSYIYIYAKWITYRLLVTAVNGDSLTLLCRSKIEFSLFNKEACRIKVVDCLPVNKLELSISGDYYYVEGGNSKQIAFTEFDSNSVTERTAAQIQKLVSIKNCAHVSFKNITFRYNGLGANHALITEFENTQQAERVKELCGIEILQSAHINILSCKFSNLFGYAIKAERSSHLNFERNKIHDTFSGGIALYDNCHHCDIRQNTVENYGKYMCGAVGILVCKSDNNNIVGNTICKGYYTGISLGWTWGYEDTNTCNNYVANNYIHHCMQNTLDDGGGIYMLGLNPGTVIENNCIHDIWPHNGKEGHGIYLDEGSSYVKVRRNFVSRCPNGLHQHFGQSNEILNNLFSDISLACIRISKSQKHLQLFAHNNIFILNNETGTLVHSECEYFEISGNLIDDRRSGTACTLIKEGYPSHLLSSDARQLNDAEDTPWLHDNYFEPVDFAFKAKLKKDTEWEYSWEYLEKKYGKFIVSPAVDDKPDFLIPNNEKVKEKEPKKEEENGQ